MRDILEILSEAEKERENLNHDYVGTEHFMLAILKTKETKHFIDTTYVKFKNKLIKLEGLGSNTNDRFKPKYFIKTPLLKRILEDSSTVKEVLWNLKEENEGLAISILKSLGANINLEEELELPNNCVNLCEINYVTNPAVGREYEVNELLNNLRKMNKPNSILIGKAGVGKTAIVEGLAYRIINKQVPKEQENLKIIQVNISSVLAGTRYRGDFEEKIKDLCSFFINNKDCVMFVDEIHNTINAGGSEGAINMAETMKPYLARGDVKLIGATTNQEYGVITNNVAYGRRFDTIPVYELKNEESYKVLVESKDKFEKFYKKTVRNSIIQHIIDESCKLNGVFPDKCFDLLENSFIETVNRQENEISRNIVNDVMDNLKKKQNKLKELLENK